MPAWILPAAMALISGVGNMISGNTAAEAEKRRQAAAIRLLDRSIIDDADLASMLRKQTQAFNSSMQTTINRTALHTGGFTNKEVVGAAVSGTMAVAKYTALSNTENNVRAENARIRTQQAYIVAGGNTTSDPVGDFAQGAIPGLMAGIQANRTIALTNELSTSEDAQKAIYKDSNVALGPSNDPYGPVTPYWKPQDYNTQEAW